METKVIHSRKMALYLRDNGFKIIRTIPDERIPNFFNWVFEDTAELGKCMETYKKN